MTRARQNANISPAVGRNMVINGAMNVAQRSASVTGIGAASGYFTLDRWYIAEVDASAGRFTMSQTADGPNGISANCLKLDCTTADTSIAAGEALVLSQRFEGQNLQRIGKGVAGAKQITVSFYVKANAAFTFGVELFDEDNARQITKLFATTTDWVRHELTFAADEDDGSSPFADDNANSLQLLFWLHGGATFTGGTLNTATFANNTNANRAAGIDSFFSSTDNNFFLTGVQMEVGPVATDFEQEEISTTLQKCQRYFEILADGTGSGEDTHYFSFAHYAQTSNVHGRLAFRTPKRAVPTVVNVSGTDYYGVNSLNAEDQVDDFVAYKPSIYDVLIYNTTDASGTAGAAGTIHTNNANAKITADSEL
jgi:hypothetical protein